MFVFLGRTPPVPSYSHGPRQSVKRRNVNTLMNVIILWNEWCFWAESRKSRPSSSYFGSSNEAPSLAYIECNISTEYVLYLIWLQKQFWANIFYMWYDFWNNKDYHAMVYCLHINWNVYDNLFVGYFHSPATGYLHMVSARFGCHCHCHCLYVLSSFPRS